MILKVAGKYIVYNAEKRRVGKYDSRTEAEAAESVAGARPRIVEGGTYGGKES